jgi:hypothetical protein
MGLQTLLHGGLPRMVVVLAVAKRRRDNEQQVRT